ncbi:hypothetical protein K488DRAFT_58421 [Vararia minispora EC-137]|uniref:Uncharacterized protein n=1 Tax=Vararia minispora EC-137 TaxID=1314806 RepID=A0ACB8QA18_9AGAM|nr:hypothetical protein K488DRAFT_58421 [Vararia minispora EC-137]
MASLDAQLHEYYSRRDALIHEDRSLRRENALVATEDERRADAVLRKIRVQEAETTWNDEGVAKRNMFPGMAFLTARSTIESTRIFKLLQKMPKGGLLHAHLDAVVNKAMLLKYAYECPEIHMSVGQALTVDNVKTITPVFKPIPVSPFTGNAGLSAAQGYRNNSWVPLVSARETFDPALGGPEGFDRWLLDSQMINPTEAYLTHNSVKRIWQKFLSTFPVTGGLFLYRPIYRKYIRQALLESIDDGVSYIEARINFLTKFMHGDDGQENIPHSRWVADFEEVVEQVKNEMRSQGREDEFFGAKIIYTTVKVITPEELEWYIEDAISLKKAFPNMIVGFDLVGDENELRPLIEYVPKLLEFNERVRKEGLDLPLILHAGETLSDGGAPDNNMYDAILLGSKRIGHGYSIVKHPSLMRICRERGIAMEVCPISNEILRLTSSIPAHPLPAVINQGVPVCLNSDDPAVFGSMGLTYDYFQVFVSSEVSGVLTLAQLARDSLTFSTLPEDAKQRALQAWEHRWSAYVKEIGDMYEKL